MKKSLDKPLNIATMKLPADVLEFGLTLRKLRTAAGLTCQHVADAGWVREASVRKMEAGMKLPAAPSTLRMIERELNCKPEYLVSLAEQHRKYLAQFIELFSSTLIELHDLLRFYQPDEAEKVLLQIVNTWKFQRKEEQTVMKSTATPRPLVAPKAAPTRKPTTKSARARRSTTMDTAKTAAKTATKTALNLALKRSK